MPYFESILVVKDIFVKVVYREDENKPSKYKNLGVIGKRISSIDVAYSIDSKSLRKNSPKSCNDTWSIFARF